MASSAAFAVSHAAAQPLDRLTRLPALDKSVVTTDDSRALVNNPANLAFMPGSELRWSSIYLDENAEVNFQGHAVAFGVPLPLVPVGTGLRLEFIDPPRDAQQPTFNYQWLTWGLSVRASKAAALGFSIQRSFADAEIAHALTSWSLGLSLRPFDPLALAFVAHDINGPDNDAGGRVDRSYDFGLAIRPLGSRALEVGLEAKLINNPEPQSDIWVPRATLGVDVGPIGRINGEFSITDPTQESLDRSWLASLSLSLYVNGQGGSNELTAGSVFGNGLGEDASDRAWENVHTEIAFRGFREPVGPELPRQALRIRIEETPSTRSHVALLRQLWSIAEREPSVAAVVFELRTAPAMSLARVQELRDAIYYLRQRGKRVLCHFEDADGSSLYLCSAADRILVNSAGGIRFAGLRSRYIYYKGLLDKLGVRADFIRIGAHKSAPESYTRTEASDVARADHIDLLQQFEKHMTLGISSGRRIAVPALRERIAKGPFIASEAKAAGLVDGFAFDDELEEQVGKLVGSSVGLVDDNRATRAPEYFGGARGIAIVYVDGDMVDGRNLSIPFLGIRLAGSYTIADALKDARKNPSVGAIVLRVETPGGSSMAADVIWREVQITAKSKPVIVSMGSYAASGGYYISAPATRIFANPLSVTGSIGIFYGKADVVGLMDKLGVSVETYKTTPRADVETIFRPFTDEERQELEKKVAQFYDMFVSRVAEGRNLAKSHVDNVGQGRVWTGEQAQGVRLVDELGGLRQAIHYARELADLPEHGPILELPKPEQSLIGMLLGLEGVHADAVKTTLPPELYRIARALAAFTIFAPDKPLARMELVDIEP